MDARVDGWSILSLPPDGQGLTYDGQQSDSTVLTDEQRKALEALGYIQ